MGEGVSVATIEELERLWYELSRELVASGSVEKLILQQLLIIMAMLRKRK